MLKIGSLALNTNVLLAPLAGISDASFRLIARKFGAGFTFVEMINARAISHKNKKTKKMLTIDPRDRPIGIQLLGAEIPYLLKALEIIEKYDFDLLDFNAACPVRKVCRRFEGASLMKEPEKLKKILEAIVNRWQKPVTIKIRSGWDDQSKNACHIAMLAQDAGVKAIFIHGRNRTQFYKDTVDYSIIADVKKCVSIPVIASGDIWSAQHAKKMFDETGCDGVLVARGGLGNPWIFQQIDAYINRQEILPPPSTAEILNTIIKHMELCTTEHGEKNGIKIMRKFVGWYLKGKPYIRSIRQKIHTIKDKAELLALIDSIRQIEK